VRRYLPWFTVGGNPASARITLRQLLTHTSGLSLASGRRNFADSDASDGALERAVRSLDTEKLGSDPGTGFQYSNANYQILGAVVEAVSRLSYSRYIEQNVFLPLGMTTSFADEREARGHGAAIGSRYWFGRAVSAPEVPSPKSLEPAAELYASARDMGDYMSALLQGGRRADVGLLSTESVHALFTPATTTRSGVGYAMGWFIAPGTYPFGVWHDGSTPNFHAHVALDLATHRGFALLVNAETYLSGPRVGDLALGIVSILRGQTPRPVPRSSVPPELMALLAVTALKPWASYSGSAHLRVARRRAGTRRSRSWPISRSRRCSCLPHPESVRRPTAVF
jgi:CubicO group peptidase (beta-lactamase class C family)